MLQKEKNLIFTNGVQEYMKEKLKRNLKTAII